MMKMRGKKELSPAEKLLWYTFHVVGWFWNVFSFYPWYILSGNYKQKRLGHQQGKSTTGKSEGPYRSIEAIGGLTSNWKGLETLDQIFQASINEHGDKKCLGTRNLISEEDEIQPNGRIFKKAIYGDYSWLTYNEMHDYVKRISSGLKALGVETKQNVIIFAETKAEWMLSAQACFMRNFPVVTIYATLGDEAIVYGFNEVESTIVMTDAALMPKLKSLGSQLRFIKTIIYFGDTKKSCISEFPEALGIYSLQQVKDLGSKMKNYEALVESPLPEDTAVIMYTSGSTGVPKGVIISHANITSFAAAVLGVIEFLPTDRYIGYLPLAHIMEMVCELCCMAKGVPIGYSSALTLSDMSSKIKKGSKGDVSVLKPTVMAAVPMIMDRMRKAVLDKMNSSPRHTQLLFEFACEYKRKLVRKGYDTPLLNRLVFSKVRAILGGQVRTILSGGAPLSADTQEFMNVCFCCSVMQGYGLTETCAGCTLTAEWDHSNGRAGRPLSCLEVKLESWEEGGYTVNDQPHPRGEIVISGHNVTKGYLHQDEKTREVYKTDSDGKVWFHTGDIGEVMPDGVFKVIDRKKDLVKLSHGEYVSLGKIEATLKHSHYVENCCVYGDSKESYLIALIVPNQPYLTQLSNELGISGSFEELCGNSQIIEKVVKDMQVVSKERNLNKSETPHRIKLCAEHWTPEADFVTAAFKLKRKNIQNFYQRDIKTLYGQ